MSEQDKAPSAFKTISEVAEELDVPAHVLRFWEQKFPHISPLKRRGGRRYYRPEDVQAIQAVKSLLYDEGYTIKGAARYFSKNRSAQKAPVDVKSNVTLMRTAPATGQAEGGAETLETVLGSLREIQNLLKEAA